MVARDPQTGETSLKVVTWVKPVHEAPVLELTLELVGGRKEVVVVTGEHPFWVPARGWVTASALAYGDMLESVDGSSPRAVARTWRAEPEPVYNFEVHDLHTYFVGQGETLAHNMCPQQGAITATERAIRSADLGLSGKGIEALQGTVSNAGTTRIINIANI